MSRAVRFVLAWDGLFVLRWRCAVYLEWRSGDAAKRHGQFDGPQAG
jgi:hypothetical protein